MKTIIQDLGEYNGNHLWMKRDDLIPFSFGGNKARKAQLFFREIDKGDYDCVVTYGSGSSNHCRIVANECCRRGLDCCIISPESASEASYNGMLMSMFGAKVLTVLVSDVHDTIERTLNELRAAGRKPYFIPGGGHGDIGTEAYVQCYREILEQEKEAGVYFDDIFLASGTGTTQAGLICGKLLEKDERRNIVGISIARKNPYGRGVVAESVRSYLGTDVKTEDIENALVFLDDYTDGYGKEDRRVDQTISDVMKRYGIPLDPVYTGKAFFGMREYLTGNHVTGHQVLMIHTGGLPIYFDWLKRQ